MSDVPVQLIVAAFKTEDGASNALDELKAAKKEHLIKIDNAAILRKDAEGEVHIKELKDMGGGKGAAVGGVLGAGLGILTGGATLAVAGLGALLGGLAAKARDGGFNDTRLRTLGDSLTPGSSALVAVIEHRWVADMEAAMREAGADVLTETISADVAAQLEAGRESAYTLVSSDEGVAGGRVVTGQGVTAASSFVATDQGVAATRMVATSAGAAAEQVVATDQGVDYTAVVILPERTEGDEAAEETGPEASTEDK
jgi:uncharacterized membrane protein